MENLLGNFIKAFYRLAPTIMKFFEFLNRPELKSRYIYLITLALSVSALIFFYSIQVTYVYKRDFWSTTILIPTIVGVIVGLLFGKIVEQSVQIRKSYQLQETLEKQKFLNKILILSNEKNELLSFLEHVLKIVLETPFAMLQSKAGIFLKQSDDRYRMVVHNNLDKEIIENCSKKGIVVGECLCGLAIQKKAAIFTNHVDDSHTFKYSKMHDHGHYNLPILNDNEVIGVLVIYVEGGHSYSKTEEDFLKSVVDILSLAIRNFKGKENEKNLNLKLKAQNNELLKTYNELDRFLYSASHDLRAPLASILGLVNIWEMDQSESNRDLYTKGIRKSVVKLDEYIRDIIDFTKNANSKPDLKHINLDEMLQSIYNRLQEVFPDKPVKLVLEDELKTDIVTDAERLRIILRNVIGNSLKYSKESNPYVKCSLRRDNGYIFIYIIDNGIGIEKQHLTNIFNMFYKGSLKSTGSGLGLYIAKESVQTLKGTIEISSEEGKGTEVVIKLPELSLESIITQ